jgi:predicted ribosomally synthesized peptide with nif11-like leader
MGKVEEFREAVNANEDWQEEVRNFGDDDNIVSYASGKGYEFTANEYSEYVENNISGELSLFETELVSGGQGGDLAC